MNWNLQRGISFHRFLLLLMFLFFNSGLGEFPRALAASSRPSFFSPFQKMNENQKKKESSRWTLEDWLSQKSRINWMDYWLAMNTSPVNFEMEWKFSRWAFEQENRSSSEKLLNQTMDSASISLYYRILGLTAEYDNFDKTFNRKKVRFNLRIIGTSLQSSHLTLFYGVQEVSDQASIGHLEQSFGGGILNLYIFRFIGLSGYYESDFKATDKNQSQLEGNRWSYGAFLEWGFLRIYGNVLTESSLLKLVDTESSETIGKGTEVGIQFNF